jgi:2-methylcitrate dehydratase PrpD
MKDHGATILTKITDFTLGLRVDDIPASALDRAAWLLLDTLGIAAGSVRMEAGRIARDTACELYGAGPGAQAARMLFDGRPVSPAGAAFAAATQIDNLDGHDGYNPTKGHIGVAVVPALAALAEALPVLTGPQALAAMVVGYEVAGRAAISLHATVADYHTSGAWNALGVAAMAARLRGNSPDQLRQALGIAEYHGPRSQMMREIETPTMLHDGSRWGAMVGLSATILAEKGFQGAPAITVEAAEAARHWQDLGEFWTVERQYIKPYPICRWAHAAIDAVRGLIIAHDFGPEDVAEVRIGTFHEAACLYAGMPATTSMAQYSLPFAVAAMIAHRRIGTEHITGDGLTDPAVAALLPRIHVAEHVRHSQRFPAGRWADVTVTLRDGTRLDSGDTNARGGPEAPLTGEDIVEKFMGFAAPVLGAERAERIVAAARGMTAPGSRFADLMALAVAPA